jgi:hypothetical protein
MQDIKNDFRIFLRETKKTIIDEILIAKLDYEEAKEIFNITKERSDYLKMKEFGLILLELSPENENIEDELKIAKAQIIE